MSNYIYVLVLSVIIASFSQIILKKGSEKDYPNVIREYLNPHVIIGYSMMMVCTVCTLIAYAHVEYKNGPVIESLGFLFVMVLSRIFLKEKITKKKLIGNAFILLGIVIFYL